MKEPQPFRRYFKRTGSGSAHVLPPVAASIVITILAIFATAFSYAWLISYYQSQLHAGIENSPVIRSILEGVLGQPLQPAKEREVDADSEDTKTAIGDRYMDAHAVSPAGWLEVLKRLGMADADSSIQDYYGPWPPDRGSPEAVPAANIYSPAKAGPEAHAGEADLRRVSSDNLPVAMLIADLMTASQGLTLAEIKPLPLITKLALQLGGHSSDGLTYSGDCWNAALAQVMADYPDRWPKLAEALRQPPNEKAASTCPWTGGGELAAQPSSFRYTVRWLSDVPSDADIVRALFVGAGALNASKWPSELRPSATDNVDHAAEMEQRDGATQKDVIWLNRGSTREIAIAEQFARQLLAATMTTADAAWPKLWVDMFKGLPQFILNLFFILLLMFVAARWLLFRKMRREIRAAKAWLDSPNVAPALQNPEPADRAKSAGAFAEILRSLQSEGGQLPGHFSQERLRPNSLVLLMAEKATTRLIIGESQPELFREFCASRRAVVDESAWALRYLARALPALGFVGTILGILFALNGADGIVRATSQAERVAAMAAVTGPLAFAFSHTLMALIFGLITGFFIDQLTAKERIELLAYEETLIEKIDPAERMPLYAPGPRMHVPDASLAPALA